MSSELFFSLHTDQHIKDAVDIFGYAYGYSRITKHFGEFTYRNKKLNVLQNSPQAKIQMFYMEPEWYNLANMQNLRSPDFKKFYDHQYKIYGTHLEATKVWSHWIDSMNAVDEIWVGNYFAKDSVINSGVKTPTYVFEHGIDDMWKPFMRGKKDKIRFLHVDSDSPRKRADLVEKAFLELFKNNPNYELTLKYHSKNTNKEYSVLNLFEIQKTHENVNKIYQTISQDELVKLYYDHDILVYPSEGEGFGFIPLQALATGMPTISTGRWCSYEKYLGNNIVESFIGKTSHTGYFEGEVVLADYDSLVYQMKHVVDNIDDQCKFFYNQAEKVYKEYNWQNKCNQMLSSLIKRVGIDALKDSNLKDDKMIPIRYVGNGSYSLVNGVRFDTLNRVQTVTEEEARYLVISGHFQKIH